MKYKNIVKAKFLNRPNRFIASVDINGTEETVHVKNTGRCKELLVPGCTVYLSESVNLNRKTRYDLIAVIKERIGNTPLIINMDSQIPNDIAGEWLCKNGMFSAGSDIRREVKYQSSRFDFLFPMGEDEFFWK